MKIFHGGSNGELNLGGLQDRSHGSRRASPSTLQVNDGNSYTREFWVIFTFRIVDGSQILCKEIKNNVTPVS